MTNKKKNTFYKEENGTEEQDIKLAAIGFLKTHMADSKVAEIADTMEKICDAIDVELVDVIVDRGGSRCIDRPVIDDIYLWLDTESVHVLILGSLEDISEDRDDFIQFLEYLDANEVILISLDEHKVFMPGDKE